MKKLLPGLVLIVLSIMFVSMYRPADDPPLPKSTWALEFSHDDKFFALGGDDSILHIYNAKTFQLHKRYKLNSMIKNLTWHVSGKIIAVSTLKNVELLDIGSGTFTAIPNIGGARAIAWNVSGEMLGVASNGLVHVLDRNGKLIRTIEKHDRKSYLTVDWSKDNIIATGSDEIILFDTSGKQLFFLDHRKEYRTGVLTVRWHPSGEFFVSGDYGHEGEGILTNLEFRKKDGTLIKNINGHHAEIRNARWNKDGTLLATASDALRIYNDKGDLQVTGAAPGKYNIWSVAWSNDGKTILTSSNEANHLDVWDSQGKFIKRVF